MAQFKSRAFVIHSAPYRETSRLLHVFCPDEGKLSLVARGLQSAKSKKTTAAEPFNLVQIRYSLKEAASIGSLGSIEVERVFTAGRSNIQAYAAAAFWFDVLQHATQPRLSAPDLFRMTDDFLIELDQAAEVDARTVWHFARLLHALGFGVTMDRCIVCGRADELLHFDLEQGSAVCSHCAASRASYFPVPESHAPFLRRTFAMRKPIPGVMDRHSLPFSFVLINELLTRSLEAPLKSYAFLAEVIS